MSKFSRTHTLASLIGLMLLVTLAACGGGGGGSASTEAPPAPSGGTAPVTPPGVSSVSTGTLTILGSTSSGVCEVLEGQSGCTLSAAVTTTAGVTKADIVASDGGIYPLSTSASTTINLSGKLGDNTSYQLRVNDTLVGTPTIAFAWQCAGGTWEDDQAICRARLTYEPIVIADANLATEPLIIKGQSCTKLRVAWMKNQTPYQIIPGFSLLPLGPRFFNGTLLPSGRIAMFSFPFENRGTTKSPTENFVLNPLTETIRLYDGDEGTFPSVDPTLVNTEGWFEQSPVSTDPTMGQSATTGAWTVFAPPGESYKLYCREAGAADILLREFPANIQFNNFMVFRSS